MAWVYSITDEGAAYGVKGADGDPDRDGDADEEATQQCWCRIRSASAAMEPVRSEEQEDGSMNWKCVCLALAMLASVPVQSDAGTNTNAVAHAASPAAIKIGRIVFEGGDGSSEAQAVVVKNAKGEEDGVAAEYAWIRRVHPGWRTGDQALLSANGKSYDRLECSTPRGERKTVFFDISAFFGK